MEQYDILIAGGGTAGTIAAIQAGRLGAKTIVIEMNGQLGGTMTTGGVCAPAYFWSPLKQIISGIGWELIEKCNDLGGASIPDFLQRNPIRPSYHTSINKYIWPLVAEEECLKANVELHYHELITDVKQSESGTWIVSTAGKMEKNTFEVKEIIDCTGDANIVRMLGLPVMRDEVRQPSTLEFRISGYKSEELDPDALQKAYDKALEDGELQPGDYCYADQPFFTYVKRGGGNLQHLFDADVSTSAQQTDTSIRGRQGLLRMLRFMRRQPGCERASLSYMATQACARDTYRIVGETQITYEDYMNAVRYPDAICNSLYFIDVHHETGTHLENLDDDKVPTIPLRALVPQGSRHILVAGRTLSSDKLAHSALRVEASCMAMGQAAAVACVLAVREGIASKDVKAEAICAELERQGALVP